MKAAALLGAVLVAACSGASASSAGEEVPVIELPPAKPVAEPPADAGTSSPSVAVATKRPREPDHVGIPECDELVEKMKRCFAGMPGPAQESIAEMLKALAELWQDGKMTSEERSAAASDCKSMASSLAAHPACP